MFWMSYLSIWIGSKCIVWDSACSIQYTHYLFIDIDEFMYVLGSFIDNPQTYCFVHVRKKVHNSLLTLRLSIKSRLGLGSLEIQQV